MNTRNTLTTDDVKLIVDSLANIDIDRFSEGITLTDYEIVLDENRSVILNCDLEEEVVWYLPQTYDHEEEYESKRSVYNLDGELLTYDEDIEDVLTRDLTNKEIQQIKKTFSK